VSRDPYLKDVSRIGSAASGDCRLEPGACVTADLWEEISRMDPKNATQMLALQLFLSFVEGIANEDLDPLDEPNLVSLANLAVGALP